MKHDFDLTQEERVDYLVMGMVLRSRPLTFKRLAASLRRCFSFAYF